MKVVVNMQIPVFICLLPAPIINLPFIKRRKYLIEVFKGHQLIIMCFSPSASFGAAAIIGSIGVVCIAHSRTRQQFVLSGIPMVFALQQFTEGVLWMALSVPSWGEWKGTSSYLFLLFAQAVWPIYIPFAMLLCERKPVLQKLMLLLLVAGCLFSAYSVYALYRYPVQAAIDQHHIRYELHYPLSRQWYYGLLYFVPTILAPVISSNKILHWLGYLFLLSYIIARLFFRFYVISVWCFFGALISLYVLVIISKLNRDTIAA